MSGNILYYPLTHPQKGIWYTEKLYPGTSIGNLAGTLKIKEYIDYNLLENAINIFIFKNDALRFEFIERDNEPVQYLTDYKYKKIDFFDFSKNCLEDMYKWDTIQTQTPFTIIRSKLYYFAILKVNDHESGLYIKMHHLISDAWSIVNSGNEIMEYYDKLKNGEDTGNENKPSYLEFIQSEVDYLKKGKATRDSEFWIEKFSTVSELTPFKTMTSKNISTKAKRKTFMLPKKLSNKIQEFCHRNNTSIFSLYLFAIALYINRITGKNEMVFGIPTLNRHNARERSMMGMFTNTVPIKLSIDNNISFNDTLEDVSREWMSVLKHHKYPIQLINKDIREKYKNLDDLFDVCISFQNAKILEDKNSGQYEGRWHFSGHQLQSLFIHISDREDDSTIIIDYDYRADLFFTKEIEFIHDHIARLLWHALDNTVKPISKIEMISEKEKEKILYQFNDNLLNYQQDNTLHQLFENQAAKTPDKTAIVFENESLSYKNLNEKANQLARVLNANGVRTGDIIGIMIHRSLDMIVSVLAVLKAGGAYLPLDPDYPGDRIKYMLENSNVKLLICQDKTICKFETDGKIIELRDKNLTAISSDNLFNLVDSNELAYVIYTSGSTGKPKGVMIEHRNIVNLMCFEFSKTNIQFNTKVLQFTTLCFDVSCQEIFSTLLSGGELYIIKDDVRKNASQLLEYIENRKIEIIFLPPSYLKHLTSNERSTKALCKSVKHIIVAGEQPIIPKLLKDYLMKYNVFFHNHYGPSETHVATTYTVDPKSKIPDIPPIGKPISNTRIYILSEYGDIVPIGIPGEIYIAGHCVGRGYINNPVLTMEKFIDDPFFPGERMYKTGDIAKWKSEGDIEFIGRRDYQVKIRGFRIELGEIESKLLNYNSVSNAVVLDRINKDGNKYLCAFLESPKNIDSNEVKRYLSVILPNYMIPSQIVVLKKIPMTANGKVDKNVLMNIDMDIKTCRDKIMPRNEMEKKIKGIFEEVLGISDLSIDDNLFDFRGDSLSVINIQTLAYGLDIKLETQDIYKYPTPRLLSEYILNRPVSETYFHVAATEEYNVINNEKVSDGSKNEIKAILLTGVTGYLGAHILDSLLEMTDANIFCIIRGTPLDAESRFSSVMQFYHNRDNDGYLNKRVFIVNGDISMEELGLDKKTYTFLGENIDTVVHTAAIVKHFGNYEDFKLTNVNGTRNIIQFCKVNGKRLYYTSTTGISGNHLTSQNQQHIVFTENDYFIGQNYNDNVYVKSKFEAEGTVFKAINNGLDACIMRIGNLTNRFRDIKFQINPESNAFQNKLRSIIKIGFIPNKLKDMDLEFTPVDLCAKAIVQIILNGNNAGRILHLFNPNLVKLRVIIEFLKGLHVDIDIIDENSFSERIKNLFKKRNMHNYLSWIVNDLNSSNVLGYDSPIVLDCKLTTEYLKQLGFKWPLIDEKYLTPLLQELIKK